MKNATAVKKASKKTAKKAPAKRVEGTAGARGRTSAYAGLKLKKLVKTEESGLRETGKVRQCWDAITNGIKFEDYRAAAPDASLARKVLADFIAKGLVEAK